MKTKYFLKLYSGIIFFVCVTIIFLYTLSFKSRILDIRLSRINPEYTRNFLRVGKKEVHNAKLNRLKSKKFGNKGTRNKKKVSIRKNIANKLESFSKINSQGTVNNTSIISNNNQLQLANIQGAKTERETLIGTSNPISIILENKMYPDLHQCLTKSFQSNYIRNGDYWILNDYIPASRYFRCNESVTYTTHSEYTYLHNLQTLSARWQGPISVAVYAPGEDFSSSINTILRLRECGSVNIKQYVTFHMIFHLDHRPSKVSSTEDLLKKKVKCLNDSSEITDLTYRADKNLTYPINIARNTARTNAKTYFNFPADIELYPSINFIPEFFKMLKKPDVTNSTNERVYVFPIFEVTEGESPPETKEELLKLLRIEKAVPFHQYVCPKCHSQPEGERWMKTEMTIGLSVFHIATRRKPFHKWEPIYVGTQREPLYDDTLSWEGRKDKMTQMYILCVRNYEFHILDNAFLVHSPGIRTGNSSSTLDLVAKQRQFVKEFIKPEYEILFGKRRGCVI